MSARIAVLFLAAVSVRAQGTGSISGIVDDYTRTVIPNTSVTLIGPNGIHQEVRTDDRGTYNFSNLPASTYLIEFSVPGFRRLRIETELAPNEQKLVPPMTLDVSDCSTLAPSRVRLLARSSSAGRLSGTISETSSSGSPPARGTTVELRCSSGRNCIRSTVTDSQGLFVFEDVVSDIYHIAVPEGDFPDQTVFAHANTESVYVLRLHLTPEEEKGYIKAARNGKNLWFPICE
jgi:hypothetical protein